MARKENDMINQLPETMQKLTKEAAAKVSGVDPDSLETQQALNILESRDTTPDIKQIINQVTNRVIDNFKGKISTEDMERLDKAFDSDSQKKSMEEAAESIDAYIKELQRATDMINDDPTPSGAKEELKEILKNDKYATSVLVHRENGHIEIDQGAINGLPAKVLTDTCINALNETFNYFNSEEFEKFKRHAEAMGEIAKRLIITDEEAAELGPKAVIIKDLIPFLQWELNQHNQEQGTTTTLKTLIEQGFDENGKATAGAWKPLIDNAAAELEKFQESQKVATESNNLIHHTANAVQKIEYGLDKVNANLWRLSSLYDGTNITIDTARNGKNHAEVNVLASLSFDDFTDEVKKQIVKLSQYDKRVYMAAAALFNAGNSVVTASQIYKTMSGNKRPASTSLANISKSLEKMAKIRLSIDNTDENKAMKNLPLYIYKGSLLPCESIAAYINGKFTEEAIHIFREPPLLEFARSRKQLTTFSRKLFDTPISHTELNMAVEDYLIQRISRGLEHQNNKILLSTLFEAITPEDSTPRQKRHIKESGHEKIKAILNHYKNIDFIKDFTLTKNYIHIEK